MVVLTVEIVKSDWIAKVLPCGFPLAENAMASELISQLGSYGSSSDLACALLFAGGPLQPQSVENANLLPLDFNDTRLFELSQSCCC